MTATTTEQRFTTRMGDRVNRYSDLCDWCAAGVARSAAHHAFDDEFDISAEDKLKLIREVIEHDRRWCRENCGRVPVEAV